MDHPRLTPFPSGFLWGAASAAYQVEGAHDADGKGPSIWDEFTADPGRTFRGSNGRVAVDHYHRWREDVALMAAAGLRAYRFSISWPRILPGGTRDADGTANAAGLAFYSDLVDELLAHGITPVVTLYHWDLPAVLQAQYGGWESRYVVQDFTDYATVLFDALGDRVRHWITLNEQNFNLHNAYLLGTHPPAVADPRRFYQANHHAFLAQAAVVDRFRSGGYPGIIGPSFAYSPVYPASSAPADVLAAENAEEAQAHWWLDTYVRGRYPRATLAWLESAGLAPQTESGDEELLARGTPDFLGVNYYYTTTVTTNGRDGVGPNPINTTGRKGSTPSSGVPGLFRTTPNPHLPTSNWDWAIDATGLRVGLRRLTSRYNLPVMITENGLGEFDRAVPNDDGGLTVHDPYRIDYLRQHIVAMQQAVTDGVEVLGYFPWAFTDLLSWLNGYQKRYGMVYVDRDETDPAPGTERRTWLARFPKDSYAWYRRVVASNGTDLG